MSISVHLSLLLVCPDVRKKSHVPPLATTPTLLWSSLPDILPLSHKPIKSFIKLSLQQVTLGTSSPIHTFNIHPTVHGCLPQGIDGLASVDASIKGARLADLQGADPQVTEGSVLGVALEIHLVL